MNEAISGLGMYLGPVILLAVEILVGFYLLINRTSMRHRRQHADASFRDEKLYYQMIGHAQSEMHLLVKHGCRRVVFATDNVERVSGVSLEKLKADLKNLEPCMGQKESRAFWEKFDAWERKEPLEMDFYQNQQERWMQILVTVCEDPAYDLFVLRDISAEKAKEAFMEERLVQAESVNQSKTTFLSRMSHEIRTPMNGISGMLTLIGAQPHNEITEQYLEKARNLSDYMLSLINDILDMSRIENDKMELEQRPFDLFDVADEIQNMFQKTVEAKGVSFIMEKEQFTDHHVIGDRLRLSQVLTNFVSNAAKFTDQGEVRVTFREMMREQNRVNFMIRVHDTGKGMDPKFVSRIFRPFEQEDAGIARKYGGTGLGMAITEQIVRLMGGDIVIDTMPGKGSDFTVYLTMPVAAEAETPSGAGCEISASDVAYRFAGKKILLAEDNEINAEIALEILKAKGATVTLAENGQLAVDCFRTHPAGTFDFILMDIQMPVLDGREAAQQIRALERADAATIPIFALSADAFVEDQRLSENAGMNGHFSKPIDFDALEIGVGRFMETYQQGGNQA